MNTQVVYKRFSPEYLYHRSGSKPRQTILHQKILYYVSPKKIQPRIFKTRVEYIRRFYKKTVPT